MLPADARARPFAAKLLRRVLASAVLWRLRADRFGEHQHGLEVLHHGVGGRVAEIKLHRGSEMLVDESVQAIPFGRDFMLTCHVEGAMEDLDPHLGRRDALDRFSDHPGNRVLRLPLILVPGCRVYAGYHNIIILP